MVDAAPFRGLRYDPAVAGAPATTSAPAYDELDPVTYARHRAASPYTVLELLAPPDAAGRYRAAAAALARWRRTGVLVRDETPAMYRYEEHELRHGRPRVQRGVLTAVALGTDVLTHEAVDPDRVADRRARLEAVRADLSPVFALAMNAPADLRAHLATPPTTPPLVALTDEAGVDHRVWAVTDPAQLAALQRGLAGVRLLVADGHHRYAAALAARHDHPEPAWQRILAYVVDAAEDGPEIRGVHRVVRGLPAASLRRALDEFAVQEVRAPPEVLRERLEATVGRAFGLLLGPGLASAAGFTAALLRPRDEAALVARLPAERSPRWRDLDTALLDHGVLPGLRAASVDHRADLATAAAEVLDLPDAALFLLRPIDAATAAALAAAGEHMPPKTTYFRPKPRAGLVLRPLDP